MMFYANTPLSSPITPSISPSILTKPISSLTLSSSFKQIQRTHFRSYSFKQNPFLKPSFKPIKCSVSVADSTTTLTTKQEIQTKPSPAEVCRTIMELSSVGTLSTLTQEGWPLGVGVRFAVDALGTPVLCLNRKISLDARASLHVQLEQCGSRTPQCTLQGCLNRPEDILLLKRLQSLWAKRFGEEVDEGLIYVVSVDHVLQMQDFEEDGVWVTSSEYIKADPDPLRNCAEMIVDEMNSKHMEDVHRFCNIYVNLGFQVVEAKMVWVDRLGFDLHLHSEESVFEVRIPFPREVTDDKGVKSSFNCMSQLAWEVEKNYTVPEFEKVKSMKKIR
eukprot:TRINITY_DN22903_c0_g1_i1.p1 TRINITY_DN22903_c0_g1~~TRINITY_DN22903_c0_g1_i1.p1  ORF type:complete len:332 (-),score=56.54 TRINITY_DN22903_c0_g1_i1:148-1143(-)